MCYNNYGLCSLKEYNEFKTRIYDAVDEWMTRNDADPEIGLVMSPKSLDVELSRQHEMTTGEWIPMQALITDGEADAQAVIDLADRFCFVR